MFLQSLALLLVLQGDGVTKDVVYAKPDGIELKLDVYKAENSTGATPAVIVVHGGGWTAGVRQFMNPVAKQIAASGMTAFNISYRLAPKTHMPGIVADVQTAVRYVRAHAKDWNIDPNKVGGLGHSAGGQLVLMAAYSDADPTLAKEWPGQSSKLNAVFSFAGPVDFSKDFPAALKQLVAPTLFGKKAAELTNEESLFSPGTYISKTSPPTFFLHGDKDTSVALAQSTRAVDQLKAVGVPVEIFIVKGGGHNPVATSSDWLDGFKTGIAFLKAHLK